MKAQNFIDSLLSHFSKPAMENAVPEGACPNCWGHYEYDKDIREVIRDRTIDVQNHQQTRAFIEDFVVAKVEGIKLKNLEDGRGQCPNCGKIS